MNVPEIRGTALARPFLQFRLSNSETAVTIPSRFGTWAGQRNGKRGLAWHARVERGE